jgi:hypothetical protein
LKPSDDKQGFHAHLDVEAAVQENCFKLESVVQLISLRRDRGALTLSRVLRLVDYSPIYLRPAAVVEVITNAAFALRAASNFRFEVQAESGLTPTIANAL